MCTTLAYCFTFRLYLLSSFSGGKKSRVLAGDRIRPGITEGNARERVNLLDIPNKNFFQSHCCCCCYCFILFFARACENYTVSRAETGNYYPVGACAMFMTTKD